MIMAIPDMPFESLEKILKHLPHPNYVEFKVYGNFDYHSILKQAEEVFLPVNAQVGADISGFVQNPSKATVLEIYKKQVQRKEAPQDPSQKLVQLEKVEWYSESFRATLTSHGINMHYEGKEPEFVARLREELSKDPNFSFSFGASQKESGGLLV